MCHEVEDRPEPQRNTKYKISRSELVKTLLLLGHSENCECKLGCVKHKGGCETAIVLYVIGSGHPSEELPFADKRPPANDGEFESTSAAASPQRGWLRYYKNLEKRFAAGDRTPNGKTNKRQRLLLGLHDLLQ